VSSQKTTAPPVNTPNAGRYELDPQRSTVRFTARHLFGIGRVSGSFRLLDGELTVTDPLGATSVRAVLDAASIDTGNSGRDHEVRSGNLLDALAFPTITFASDRLDPGDRGCIASGEVTARGSSAPVRLIIDGVRETAGEWSFHASAKVDRYAHGVTAAKGLAGRWLTFDIDAIVTRSLF
jgi:polyisoprenoid-binding protein YceI